MTDPANDADFTYDALARLRTRVTGAGTTDTYTYAGTGETVERIATSGLTDTLDSLVDATGATVPAA